MGSSRRTFLKGIAGIGAMGGLGGLGALLPMSPASAADTAVTPEMVRFTPEIEPLVRLIEDTPRSKCVEVLAKKIRKGTTYTEFLSALFLAGIRNINPQPPGFKFHCVFIIHSANYLSQMAPPEERLLPLFYALDDFKNSQKQDIDQGDFLLRKVDGPLPTGRKAWSEFHGAMADWDEARADRAITALARENAPEEIFETLWEYGARDYRNIGHKAIFVANSWRTLQTIGWQHAEPTLRSLVLGLLDFGKKRVLNGYAFDDQAYLPNRERVAAWADKLPAAWPENGSHRETTLELLDPLREGRIEEVCDLAVRALAKGQCDAGAVWDAAQLFAGELMMRQPGIAGIHTVTSLNGLRYAFLTSKSRETQLLMLLQGLGWMGQFRHMMDPKRDNDLRITDIESTEIADGPKKAVEQILEAVSSDRDEAARRAYQYGQRFGDPALFFDSARHLVFAKISEHHQLKWPAAIFEDYHHVSPEWRPHMLATSTYYLRGTGHKDSTVVQRAIKELKLG